jgi:hypothetical protein
MTQINFAGEDVVRQTGALAREFLLPPFSIFNTCSGPWQKIKAEWLALGIKSEEGRTAKAFGDVAQWQSTPRVRNVMPGGGGASSVLRKHSHEFFAALKSSTMASASAMAMVGGFENSGNGLSQTSIFDPVLCELVYRWYSPFGGLILDPFAGGSVRGIVAAKLGRNYFGVELRPEQVASNQEQAAAIVGLDEPEPVWFCGDSKNIVFADGVKMADFLFTCPPYVDLEVYSDLTNDLSTMDYPAFLKAYRFIIAESCSLLKDDRFACIVVGEVRGPDGNYYNFVGDTVTAFLDAGLKLYNEAILVTPTGSLPVRVGKQFRQSRKLGKQHQNVLFFLKGDAKRAALACGSCSEGDDIDR